LIENWPIKHGEKKEGKLKEFKKIIKGVEKELLLNIYVVTL